MHFPSLIGTFGTLKVIEVFPDVPCIAALHRGTGGWVFRCCVLVCESGLSSLPRGIQARDGGGGEGWDQS